MQKLRSIIVLNGYGYVLDTKSTDTDKDVS